MENSEGIFKRLSPIEDTQTVIDGDREIVTDQNTLEQCKFDCEETKNEVKDGKKEGSEIFMVQKESIQSTDSPYFVEGNITEELDNDNSGKNEHSLISDAVQ